ncbi:helix-turn-helix transcriptional regulator [Streptomyces sp. NPDC001083]|uniref:helix-turn-helix transcriptional regulator n=1 Tax=Streptomyces sp. NPDC001083 TaxID=3364545 RepID=UPI003676451E
MEKSNPLGEYLRARRELVRPEDIGIPRQGRRRVPGLRREEVSMLAGISTDYYLRLEQGKNRHPSPQVLNVIAHVLQLDGDAVAHLHRLAQPRSGKAKPTPPERVGAGMAQLLAGLHRTPAFVQGRLMDVLASNALARRLAPKFTPGVNLLRSVFMDPTDRQLHPDWNDITEEVVAGLRAAVDPAHDRNLVELVGELALHSDRFRQLWARHDVRPKAGGKRRLNHPRLGEIELRHEKLAIAGTNGQLLVIYHAEPGSPSEAALATLANPATRTPEERPIREAEHNQA